LGEVWLVADRRLGIRVERDIDLDDALKGALAIEYLDAPVGAVGNVDFAGGVGGNRMHRIELAGSGARPAPRFEPLAVLVDLGDARIDVAVGDIGIALRIPRYVGRLAKAAILGG
jgi:hypothetical protein